LNNLTQTELGKKLGVIKQTVSSWENDISQPSNDSLAIMSKLFGVSIDYILDVDNSTYFISFDSDDAEIKNIFQSRLKKSLERRQIDEDALSEITHIDKNVIHKYLHEDKQPTFRDLKVIAFSLNIRTDYLLGLSEAENFAVDEAYIQTNAEFKIVNTFRCLSEDNQDIALGELKKLLKDQTKEEADLLSEAKTGTDDSGK